MFEKKRRGPVRDIYEHIAENEREKSMWKGELIIVIAPQTRDYNIEIENEVTEVSKDQSQMAQVSIRQAVSILNERLDVSNKDLADLIQQLLKVSKSRAYDEVVKARH